VIFLAEVEYGDLVVLNITRHSRRVTGAEKGVKFISLWSTSPSNEDSHIGGCFKVSALLNKKDLAQRMAVEDDKHGCDYHWICYDNVGWLRGGGEKREKCPASTGRCPTLGLALHSS